MTDYTFESAQSAPQPRSFASITHWAGAAVSLGLIVGIGVWGYKLLVRDVSGVPVVQAMAGPMRVAPKDPGGQLADHQGLAVNAVAGHGTTAPPPDQLVLAPRPAGLSAEDVALGEVRPQQAPLRSATLNSETPSLAPEAAVPVPLPTPEELEAATPAPAPTAEPAPVAATDDAETDPILALANQLAAGAVPLSALAPGETVPVVTSLEGVEQPQVQAPKPGPGLARSLRPQVRPNGLRRVAAAPAAQAATGGSGADVASAVAAVVANVAAELQPDALPSGTRLVQIGAFDSPETARAEWQRLEGRFADYLVGKDRVIQKASSGGRVFYRLRAHGFSDLADARRFCAAFVAAKVDCIPVVTR